jgi:glycerate 2-kinase
MHARQIIQSIFLDAVESVKPGKLISRFVHIQGADLFVENIRFELSREGKIFVTGAGKASALMAQALEDLLGDRISGGHVVTKYGHSVPLRYTGITEAGHPVPDENGVKGTGKVLTIAEQAGEKDLIISLISGGGSALLTDVPADCSLEDLKALNSILLRSGATIKEMNCIRKHLSNVKGGMLSRAAYPARILSLILSDVIGDPPDSIASGPTAADPTTFRDAVAIIERLGIKGIIPRNILQILLDGACGKKPETIKSGDEALRYTTNLIIGSNRLALAAAKESAESQGYESNIISDTLEGEVNEIAGYIMKEAGKAIHEKSRRCLLFGGEPTVKVTGSGKGGRNQHLALIMAGLLRDLPGITFLSAGTDGSDGPTDAAGAIVDHLTCADAEKIDLDPAAFLKDHDSWNFFRQAGGMVVTGPTNTNVMDIIILLIN